MTSSSDRFALVSKVVLLQFLLVSASTLASTKYIDALCGMEFVDNKTFCLETLTTYPPAASATGLSALVKAVFFLGTSYAEKAAGFAAEAAKTEPTLEKQFKLCNESYMDMVRGLRIAEEELKEDPMTANYDVMVCYDNTHYMKDIIGKNRDKSSEKLMEMTLMMEKLLRIVVGATEVVGA